MRLFLVNLLEFRHPFSILMTLRNHRLFQHQQIIFNFNKL